MPNSFPAAGVISSSGLQVQKALVKTTLRDKTAVEWGICLLCTVETSPSIRVSWGYGLQAQSKAGQDEEHLQRQLQDFKKKRKRKKEKAALEQRLINQQAAITTVIYKCSLCKMEPWQLSLQLLSFNVAGEEVLNHGVLKKAHPPSVLNTFLFLNFYFFLRKWICLHMS